MLVTCICASGHVPSVNHHRVWWSSWAEWDTGLQASRIWPLRLGKGQQELRKEDWAHRAVLSRMPELCPENTSAVVSGMSTRPGGPREQLGTTGSLWPSDPIILGPDESARQLVLRKIQELTIAVRREGESHPFLAGTHECFPGYSLEAIRLGFPRACAGVLSKLCCSVPSALGITLNHIIVWG